MEATIYKIDQLNTHNGAGFRTVIHFKGCPLHCSWCHNPEGISPKKEVWFNATKCIGCGTCVENCPKNALTLPEDGIKINRKRCSGCQVCTLVCPSKAMEKVGLTYPVEDVMKIINKDKFLFESSGGGITVTGGEPGNYPNFIFELFRQCKEAGIHTAFDTSGMVSEKILAKVIPVTDLVFLDIKLLDDRQSMYHTGLPVQKLKQTIQWLNEYQKRHPQLQVEIRTPLVPGINDDPESLKCIGHFIQESFDKTPNWELCMFNDLCEDKYIRMGLDWKFKGKKHYEMNYQSILETTREFRNLTISITGFFDN